MKFRSTALWMMLACTGASCSPGPVPVSQSPRDPSSPSAPEGIVPVLASAGPRPSGPESPASPAEHRDHGKTGAPPVQHAATSDAGDVSAIYVCPMHPEVTSPGPGRCPKCGMNLVPRK
jgi:hypothetical protein